MLAEGRVPWPPALAQPLPLTGACATAWAKACQQGLENKHKVAIKLDLQDIHRQVN